MSRALLELTNKKHRTENNFRNQSCFRKKSQYRIHIVEKQKLCFHYGLAEQQLLKYVRIARKTKGPTDQVLL